MSKNTLEISQSKSHMRRDIRSRRRATPVTFRTERDKRIQKNLMDHLSSLSASRVAAYVPMQHEPGGRNLPGLLKASGLQVYLPRIVSIPDAHARGLSGTLAETLEWVRYEGETAVNARGIEEPVGNAEPGVLPEVDVFLVPALAIDQHGYRLGQGGGFYDRALAQPGSYREICAIVDHEEFVSAVPTDEWDLAVNSVVTDRGLNRFDAGNHRKP